MAVKKHKLEMAIEEDYCLLGLVSDEPDYRLCWMINRQLDMDFKKTDDLILTHRKLQQEQQFSIFNYEDEKTMITYRIINNKAEVVGFFLEDLKNLDYLVHIQGDISSYQIDAFLEASNALDAVRFCVPVDLQKIKNRERLLLW
jgi:hypothetical protein